MRPERAYTWQEALTPWIEDNFLPPAQAWRCRPRSRRSSTKRRRRRVGLIGTGWYGKADLFRLIQVAPVEVVSLCDVDKEMLENAADMVATRQASKKKPRTYHDYREMLKEKDLDIVLIGTPDHWHALTMIEAVKSGADVYCQKPISVDIVEGQAMLAAARKYNRVVQVGTQRRSTPHLVEARNNIIKEGKLGKIAYVEICCYYHMRTRENPPDTAPPANLDYEMWTGPAPMRPYNKLVHPRTLARVHGIRQRHRRRHVHSHVRHGALDDGSRLAEVGRVIRRHPCRQEQQGEHHRHADRDIRSSRSEDRLDASHLGRRARSEVSVGSDLLRRQRHAEGERHGL